MTEVVYTESARSDLLDIWFYLAEESLTAADNTLDALERDGELLSRQPLAGRERPELGPVYGAGQARRLTFCSISPGLIA